MKTLKSLCKILLAGVISAYFILIIAACNEDYLEEPDLSVSISVEDDIQLSDLLYQVNAGSEIIIVQKENSIQDAVNVAESGDVIFIEPGVYMESLTMNKPDVKLIGVTSSRVECVILDNPGYKDNAVNLSGGIRDAEIYNVQCRNFKEDGAEIRNLKCAGKRKKNPLRSVTRDDLGGGIAHYQYELQLGRNQFDLVRLHRVVREHKPYHPIRTQGNVFMVHGAIQDFDDIFLTAGAESINAETSSPYYLASNNIDVWGIDLGWTMVPAETTDFTFMKDWGIEHDGDHTLIAMSLARLIRGFTGQGFRKMNLLGFSYGEMIAFDVAGRETQQHPIMNDINGLIPVDHAMKYAPEDEEFRLFACASAAAYKEQLSMGVYTTTDGYVFTMLGNLALAAPDEISPIEDFAALDFTNSQVMHFLGANTFATGSPFAPFWHFFGGDLEDLYYTEPLRYFRLGAALSPYQPMLQEYQSAACLCNEEDVSFDDYLDEITLPIYYLGAGGGMGTLGEYTIGLTSSTEVTSLTVRIPGVDRVTDFGHGDLFLGVDADELVWEPLRQWLVNHNSH